MPSGAFDCCDRRWFLSIADYMCKVLNLRFLFWSFKTSLDRVVTGFGGKGLWHDHGGLLGWSMGFRRFTGFVCRNRKGKNSIPLLLCHIFTVDPLFSFYLPSTFVCPDCETVSTRSRYMVLVHCFWNHILSKESSVSLHWSTTDTGLWRNRPWTDRLRGRNVKTHQSTCLSWDS